jgi:hypothetical protein
VKSVVEFLWLRLPRWAIRGFIPLVWRKIVPPKKSLNIVEYLHMLSHPKVVSLLKAEGGDLKPEIGKSGEKKAES